MASSMDDVLTTMKNAVVALNAIQQSLNSEVGTVTTATVTSSTFVIAGKGRLLRINVVVAGSAIGFVHNSATPSGATAANALAACPNTVGVQEVNAVFSDGLVVAPGTGQSINITYMQG